MKKTHITSLALIFIALLFILPLLWLLFASFDLEASMAFQVPKQFTFNHYIKTVTNPLNVSSFLNSCFMSLSQSCLVVIISLLAAYPLSRFNLKRKTTILYGILFLTGLPITAIMVPVYLTFFNLQIENKLWSTTLFLVATSLPYSIWMMKNFLDGVPFALEEAASIDGANFSQRLRKVILPGILPGTSVVFIYAFSASWGNFFVPFILLSSIEKLPASVTIFQFFNSYGQVIYGELAAFSVLYTLPVLVLYILSQRFMANGFAFGGAIK